MMHPSTMKLVDRLCAMTAQGKIEWTHGEAADSLVYDTEGYSVILQGEPTNIQLTDSAGVELEKVTASDLSQTPHADRGTYDVAVAALLVDAQRVARGTETAINTVLQGLDLDGDGVVDMPMEDGLVPTPAEIAEHEPDMGEDTADESGVASLADADVTDVSNAVASLADEVNQTEQMVTSAADETKPLVGETTAAEPPAQATENDTVSVAKQTAGLGIAGLGAAGLLKAARQEPEQATSEIEASVPDAENAEPLQADMGASSAPSGSGFTLSSTDASDTPLQLDPAPVEVAAEEAQHIAPSEGGPADTGGFVPPLPGQVLSLSGLTNGVSPDEPVMAGTATTMSEIGAARHNNEPEAPSTEPKMDLDAAIPPAPIAPEPPVADDVTPTDTLAAPEEVAEVVPEAEPEPSEEAPRPSRFNPWI